MSISAAAGASYVLLFAYAGSTFASVQYSILPLLWVLLGGARTVLGPLVGTLLMFYLVDIASGYTSVAPARGRAGADRSRPVVSARSHGPGAREGPAMAAVTLLSTRGLSCHFGGVKAVDGVDFDVARGEIRAIIGPNGAGKVDACQPHLRPRAPDGRPASVFAGEDISNLPVHARVARGIAYTFQVTSIFASLDVFDNVALAGRERSAARLPSDAEATRPAGGTGARPGRASRTGDASGPGRCPTAISGSWKWRWESALEPLLLILDEPTQGLSDAEIAGFIESGARHRQSMRPCC